MRMYTKVHNEMPGEDARRPLTDRPTKTSIIILYVGKITRGLYAHEKTVSYYSILDGWCENRWV